jgi:poly(3-hydroxyalkanoate) synthetase
MPYRDNPAESLFPPVAFLWPALAVASAGEMASAFAHELAHLAAPDEAETAVPEPLWTTANAVKLELPTMRLRDFSAGAGDGACLVCAPFALHCSNIADFASGHSLVETLRTNGLARLLVTDWRTATPEMCFMSIDSYLADLNVAVDELGGKADLVGLCQGGWLALAYAARFPDKVRKLVLAGAPVDIAAGRSALSTLAADLPLSVFDALVELGHGRMLGSRLLEQLGLPSPDADAIGRTLQLAAGTAPGRRRALVTSFERWYASTVDLPGTYYLQVVEWLFKQNRLAEGRFVALGRRIDLAQVRAPMFLVAADDDELVAPEQIFATERRVGTAPHNIEKATAPGGHLSLFMGATTLARTWPRVGHWITA